MAAWAMRFVDILFRILYYGKEETAGSHNLDEPLSVDVWKKWKHGMKSNILIRDLVLRK